MAASLEHPPGDAGSPSFSTSFRGFDPAEVRAHVAELNAEIRSLRDEVEQLRRRLAAMPGEADIEAARQTGREMVQEAQAVRTRMLDDVAQRRRTARGQLEALRAGREEMLRAFDAALATVGRVADEVRAAAPELLAPSDPATAAGAELAAMEGVTPTSVDDLAPAPRAPSRIDLSALVESPALAAATVSAPDPVAYDPTMPATDPAGDDTDEEPALSDGDESGDLRLGPQARDAEFLQRRTATLGPLGTTLARTLKRVLADEQNQALDRLRRDGTTTITELAGSTDEQADRYTAAAAPSVHAAVLAGAMDAGLDQTAAAAAVDASDGAVDTLARVTTDVAAPLRERIERAVSDAGGAADDLAPLLRAAYREWKVQRLDALAAELVLAAHGRGTRLGIAPGEPVRWLVDPAGPACPDADDNALAGAVPCGEAFPTGHTHPPAHPGCRCGLVRTV